MSSNTKRTRRNFSAETKLEIVLEALRSTEADAVIARRHAIAPNLLADWKRLARTAIAAAFKSGAASADGSPDDEQLRHENTRLKIKLADLYLATDGAAG